MWYNSRGFQFTSRGSRLPCFYIAQLFLQFALVTLQSIALFNQHLNDLPLLDIGLVGTCRRGPLRLVHGFLSCMQPLNSNLCTSMTQPFTKQQLRTSQARAALSRSRETASFALSNSVFLDNKSALTWNISAIRRCSSREFCSAAWRTNERSENKLQTVLESK